MIKQLTVTFVPLQELKANNDPTHTAVETILFSQSK